MTPLVLLVLLGTAFSWNGQETGAPDRGYDVKRCTPKVVRQDSSHQQKALRTRKGDHPTGFSPIISYQILESGKVTNAHVKRSSGVANIDAYALRSIQNTLFNKRPGCGVIDADADVTIDFW